jgi:hypothetical protein
LHWKDIDSLFRELPASPYLLECYSHYLYHIGRESLPEALVLIAEKFPASLGEALPSDSNASFYLNAIVSRLMFADLPRLKSQPSIRAAILKVLDGLIESGSSIAFQLRDDFVTPHVTND